MGGDGEVDEDFSNSALIQFHRFMLIQESRPVPAGY
jgi:hypothetical protein